MVQKSGTENWSLYETKYQEENQHTLLCNLCNHTCIYANVYEKILFFDYLNRKFQNNLLQIWVECLKGFRRSRNL